MVTACPKCGYSNNGIDTRCANCSYPLPEDDGPVRRRRRFTFTVVHFGIFVLVLGVSCYMIWGAGNWTKPDNNNDFSVPKTPDPALASVDDSRTAWIMMCDFMREKVRTPGLASFPELGVERTHAIKKSGSTYAVCGYVDFEGDSNATVRRYFKGEVTQLRVGSWRLDSWELGKWDSMAHYFAE